jgi:hypothetical protein
MITGAETAHLNPKIPTIFLEGKLPLVVERSAAELGLRDGQVIQSTVENRQDRIRLILQDPAQAGRFIDLPKELPAGLRLASGDTALFRVQLQSDGSIWLRPLQATVAAAPAAAAPLAQMPNRMQQLGFRPPDMNALALPVEESEPGVPRAGSPAAVATLAPQHGPTDPGKTPATHAAQRPDDRSFAVAGPRQWSG